MGENLRFVQILDDLRKGGVIADYVEAASILETNKAGISDIKSGRKKLSVEMLRRLKLSYPSVNIDYIIMGEGEPFISDKPVVQQGETSMFLDRIAEQAEEIGRLKARIEELERRRGDSASDAQTSSIASVGWCRSKSLEAVSGNHTNTHQTPTSATHTHFESQKPMKNTANPL